MADDDEERALEEELELQLQDQRDSLNSLNDALAADPSNSELLAVHSELVQAISDAEEGLLHLKRARLLREVDYVLQGSKGCVEDGRAESLDPSDVEVEPLVDQSKAESLDPSDVEVEPLVDQSKAESLDPSDVEVEPLVDRSYSIGSKCRFRHTNGRWYNGLIFGLEGFHSAKISFLTPTSESMLICKFFLQQRCRFGSNCRLSHGVDVPVSSLKKYVPTVWEQSLAGSNIWVMQDTKSGIWREAELESWDEKLNLGNVVFRDDGSCAKLGTETLSLSEFAEVSDEEGNDSGSEETDYSDSEEDISQGLGFLGTTTMQKGIQTETAIFAKWENHTRGIASKMMASMGYREGMGLGASGQGMVDPISVKVLPPKQSLDHAVENQEKEKDKKIEGKKRSRGGKRKREKKFAAAARDAKEQEESRADVFSLINTQLAKHGETLNGGSTKKQQNKANAEGKKENRRLLVAYEDEIKELRMRVEKLEEMLIRNKKEKVVYDAAMRKLIETRKLLAEAEAAHASASNAVFRKEKEKRWLKF